MHGFEKWPVYFTDSRASDELPILPVFYVRYFRAFKSLILKDPAGALKDLEDCIALSRRRGFYIGTSCCYFLKKMYGIRLSAAEEEEYEALQKYSATAKKHAKIGHEAKRKYQQGHDAIDMIFEQKGLNGPPE